jgi:hypothetical protein
MRNKCTGTHIIPNWQDIGTGVFIWELGFMQESREKSQRTFGTFTSSNTQAEASACKRAKF